MNIPFLVIIGITSCLIGYSIGWLSVKRKNRAVEKILDNIIKQQKW